MTKGNMVKTNQILIIAVFLAVFLSVNAHAHMVSVFVIETGLPDNGDLTHHSEILENAFLDVFFEAGYIVSNAPILRLERKPEDGILRLLDMEGAREVGIDFIIAARLDFHNVLQPPEEISFFIYKINPQEMLLERVIEGIPLGSTLEELNYMKSIARGFVSYIK